MDEGLDFSYRDYRAFKLMYELAIRLDEPEFVFAGMTFSVDAAKYLIGWFDEGFKTLNRRHANDTPSASVSPRLRVVARD